MLQQFRTASNILTIIIGFTTFLTLAQVPADNNTLIIATTTALYGLDITNLNNVKKYELNFKNVVRAVAVVYDPVDDRIYWSDVRADSISRAFLNGTNQEVIVSEHVTNTDGIALDVIGRMLYWTDTDKDEIEVMTLNGKCRKTLVKGDLYEPRAIALDTEEGYMFWTDWGLGFHKIERGFLDGTSRVKIVSTNIAWPNGLVVDVWSKKVYWADAKTDKIEFVDYFGNGRKVLTDKQIVAPFAMSESLTDLYWTDWREDIVYSIPKDSVTGIKTSLYSSFNDIMGLTYLNKTVPRAVKNRCAVNNGGCSHFCFNRLSDYVCGCPSVFTLKEDQKTCDVAVIFFLEEQHLKSTEVLNGSTINNYTLTVESTKSFDIKGETLYWTDDSLLTIGKANISSGRVETIIWAGLRAPQDIAIDWLNDNLYWTDMRQNRIEMSTLDGRHRKVILWKDLDSPNLLRLDPYNGYMYWSSWGSNVQIEKASLDGTFHEIIITDTGRVADLAVDSTEDFLYWIDADEKIIFRADKEGKRQARLVATGLQMPTNLLLSQQNLIWYDMSDGTLELTDTMFGSETILLRRNMPKMKSPRLVRRDEGIDVTECSLANCSHLCLSHVYEAWPLHLTRKVSCYCESHYILNTDEMTCSGPKNFMLITSGTDIYRVVPEGHDVIDVPIQIGDSFQKKLSATRSTQNGDIYVLTPGLIFIENPDGAGSSVVRLEEETSDVSNLLFSNSLKTVIYADWKKKTVYRLLGDLRAPLIESNQLRNQSPRHIATHWFKNLTVVLTDRDHIFVCEHSGEPCALVAASTDSAHVISIALDAEEDFVYWVNYNPHTIERCLLNGQLRSTIVSHLTARETQLAIHNRYIYWLSERKRKIHRKLLMEDKEEVETFMIFDKNIDSITSSITKHLYSTCPQKDGQFCYYNRTTLQPTYYCPKQRLKNSEGDCMTYSECLEDGHMACPGNLFCVLKPKICNGVPDCPGGEDEADCTCEPTKLSCSNSSCQDGFVLCDGALRCSTSKNDICCPEDQYLCKADLKCYSLDKVCDDPLVCPAEDRSSSCASYQASKGAKSSNTAVIAISSVIAIIALIVTAILLYIKFRKTSPPRSSLLIQEELES